MKKNIISFVLLIFVSGHLFSQDIGIWAGSPQELVEGILTGNKQGVSDVNYFGGSVSMGIFNSFENTIGLSDGIILSTGLVKAGEGPNKSSHTGALVNGLGEDSSLGNLTQGKLYDITYVEFEFVPSTNVISFDYVFASEEYPEWVFSQFNDIFGFFVSGPGIDGEINIARVPENDSLVSTNNVNGSINSDYFVLNTQGQYNIEFDGFTVVLNASAVLIPFETYHIKMAIADVSDGLFDSAVFLKAKSFESKPLVFTFDFAEDNFEQTLFEDSTSLLVSATLPAVSKVDITYHFVYAGDAHFGEDYTAPESFTFKAGETKASFKIKALADGLVEGDETMMLVIKETQDTLTIKIKDANVVSNYSPETKLVELVPNPAKDVFALPSDMDVKSVDIYSLSGKRVKQVNTDFDRINIGDLPKGFYSIRIQTKDKVMVSKLKVE